MIQLNKKPTKLQLSTQKIKSSAKQSIKLSAIRTSSQRVTYLFRCGKKENIEAHLRKFFMQRAKKRQTTQNKRYAISASKLFAFFFLFATPFIGLKTQRKRRGKRVISKLVTINRAHSERKSFGALASILRTSSRSSKVFASRLEQELEALTVTSRNRLNSNTNTGQTHSTLREKRDLVHQTAFTSRPRN